MEFDLGNISVMYPNENTTQLRKLIIRPDGEILHIDISDETRDSMSIVLEKHEVELLSDTLKLIVKNKLIESI